LTLIGSYPGTGINTTTIVVPAVDLHPSTMYVMRVTTSDPTIWTQIRFSTTV